MVPSIKRAYRLLSILVLPLNISRRFRKTPLEFLAQDETRLQQTVLRKLIAIPPANRNPKWKNTLQKAELRKKLLEIIDADEIPPPSMRQISKRLNHDHSPLIRLFPEQTQIISKRFRDYKAKMRQKRVARIRQNVAEAPIEFMRRGDYPSLHRVQALLAKPCDIWEATETWRTTKSEWRLQDFLRKRQ